MGSGQTLILDTICGVNLTPSICILFEVSTHFQMKYRNKIQNYLWLSINRLEPTSSFLQSLGLQGENLLPRTYVSLSRRGCPSFEKKILIFVEILTFTLTSS